jgi:hypothetical protein
VKRLAVLAILAVPLAACASRPAHAAPVVVTPAESLFRPGGLTEGVSAGWPGAAAPEYMRDKYTPPEAAAGLAFA